MKLCSRCKTTYVDAFEYCPICGYGLETYKEGGKSEPTAEPTTESGY